MDAYDPNTNPNENMNEYYGHEEHEGQGGADDYPEDFTADDGIEETHNLNGGVGDGGNASENFETNGNNSVIKTENPAEQGQGTYTEQQQQQPKTESTDEGLSSLKPKGKDDDK